MSDADHEQGEVTDKEALQRAYQSYVAGWATMMSASHILLSTWLTLHSLLVAAAVLLLNSSLGEAQPPQASQLILRGLSVLGAILAVFMYVSCVRFRIRGDLLELHLREIERRMNGTFPTTYFLSWRAKTRLPDPDATSEYFNFPMSTKAPALLRANAIPFVLGVVYLSFFSASFL